VLSVATYLITLSDIVPSAIFLSVIMPSVNIPNITRNAVALSFKEKMKLKK
jgi:hypothetical protein